jgi:hypothetical protein
MNFEKFYNNTPDKLKIKYLNAIIKNNEKLKEEFKAFVKSTDQAIDSLPYDDFLKEISKVKNLYQESFEAIDTENPDWDNYDPPHDGYIEEWEQYQMASEQEIEEIFSGFVTATIDKILQQRTDEIMAGFIGLYEAAKIANIPDTIESFEDVNEFLLETFEQTIASLNEKLRLRAIANQRIMATYEILFRYFEEAIADQNYDLRYFEPVLLTLAEMSDSPEQILEMMNKTSIDQQFLPELSLLLNKLSGNHEKWLQTALQLYQNSDAVARELLHFYHEKDQERFITIAKEMYAAEPYVWARFLASYITPALDRDLFVNVFMTLISNELKIEYYLKIRTILNDTEYEKLINSIRYYPELLVKVFEADKHFEKIKNLIESSSSIWNFEELIKPLLHVYPQYCYQKIAAMTSKTLINERGRSIYEKIAKWMVLAKMLPGMQQDVMILIAKTYSHKPYLPALKDEMRKAGVV